MKNRNKKNLFASSVLLCKNMMSGLYLFCKILCDRHLPSVPCLPQKHILFCLFVFLFLIATSAFTKEFYSSLSRNRQEQLISDAELAAAAYKDGSIPMGFRSATRNEFLKYFEGVTDIEYDPITGYFKSTKMLGTLGLDGSLMVDRNTGEIVLSFGGTDSTADVVSDFVQAVGILPPQYDEAAAMLEALVRNTSLQQKIKVVGHSLGGGLASYSSLYVSSQKVTTTVFNPAGLVGITAMTGAVVNEDSISITTVCNGGDPVSRYGNLYGDLIIIENEDLFLEPPEHDSLLEAVFSAPVDAVYAAFGVIFESFFSHSIYTTISDMNRQKKSKDTEEDSSHDQEDFITDSDIDNEEISSSDESDSPQDDHVVGGSDSPKDDYVVDGSDSPKDDHVVGGSDSPKDDHVVGGSDSPDGDNIVKNPDDSSLSGDDSVAGDVDPSEDDDVLGGFDNSATITDDQGGGGNADDSDDSADEVSFLDVVDSLAEEFSIVMPTIPHYRLLWIFSGEAFGSSIGALWNSFKNKGGEGSISDLEDNFDLMNKVLKK